VGGKGEGPNKKTPNNMKKYIQPSLTVIKMETEDILCLSVKDEAADKDAEVLSRRKNGWNSSIWSSDEEN